jgi:hypothetical protein
MSGSPVYEGADPDGRLIGAVAYGLSFGPSMIAGLTAAEDMNRLLDLPAAAPQQTINLSQALQQEVTATGAASAHQAAAGLKQLPLPLGVHGVSAGRLQAFAGKIGVGRRFIPYSAGAAAAPGDPAEIVPGGNIAAALSYGDVSAAGVGTTTAVCDGRALAFGHPMAFGGPTALSVHNATAITIQDDPTLVPFKLANIGGIVGTLDQDRLAGIRGLLGASPTPIDVTSTVTDANRQRDGLTSVNRTLDVPGIAFGHLVANIDRVIDRIGGGRSQIGWTVSGTARGEHFSLSRNNRFADQFDISIASSNELVEQLSTLVDNPFADVTLDGLRIDAALDPTFQRYRITGLERHNGAAWVRIDPAGVLMLAPGSTLRVRALLAAHRSDAAIPPVEMTFTIPQDAGGRDGSLDVMSGAAPAGEEGEFAEFGGPPPSSTEPASFNELLASLRDAPRGDDVVGQLSLFGGGPSASAPLVTSSRTRVAEVVTGSLSIPVFVEGGGEPPFEPPFDEPPFDEPGFPRARLSLGGQKSQPLGPALRRGIRITVRSSTRGRLVLRALLSRKAARRFDIAKRGPVVVGTKRRRVGAGRTPVTLKLKRGARDKLRDATRVRLTIRARLTTAAGTRTDRFAVVLRRRAV